MTSRKSCESTINSIFNIIDRNNDAVISRCEDIAFQRIYLGADADYATQFSEYYSRATFAWHCNEWFDH